MKTLMRALILLSVCGVVLLVAGLVVTSDSAEEATSQSTPTPEGPQTTCYQERIDFGNTGTPTDYWAGKGEQCEEIESLLPGLSDTE